MVVKEDRGRKRYILFSHSGQTSKSILEKFIRDEIQILGGKIRSKLIKFGSKKSVIRVDHNLLTKAREIMNKKKTFGIKTMRTSGTLKTLEKY